MPRARLTQAAVVDAAAALIDSTGKEVSLATLAAHLGLRVPSLYNHIAGQEGLRRELTLRALRSLTNVLGRAAVGVAGDAALIALAYAYREFAHEHPGLYATILRAPDDTDADLAAASAESVGVVRAVLVGYGLTGADGLHAVRGFRSVLHGFVALEAAGGFGLPLDRDESFRRLLHVFVVGLRQASSNHLPC